MTRMRKSLAAGLAAAAVVMLAAALDTRPAWAGGATVHRAHRHAPPGHAHYGYAWRPGYGWYVAYRPRLPARAGFVPVGGPVPYGAYGPVGWVTPYQDGTIYADDARRVYAYPTYVYPAATAVWGTACLAGPGCVWR